MIYHARYEVNRGPELVVRRFARFAFVSGAGDGARTRDPLLGNIRFRDLYLAKPNCRDFDEN